ncbi:hypothetical protein ACFONI_06695 [Aeromonas media]
MAPSLLSSGPGRSLSDISCDCAIQGDAMGQWPPPASPPSLWIGRQLL